MAKEGYLRDGVILVSSLGGFRIEQRGEAGDRLSLRLDRLSNELCALPHHPVIIKALGENDLELFAGDVDEICTTLARAVFRLSGKVGHS